MQKVYPKKSEGVFVPLAELRILITNYQIEETEDEVKILEIDYEELFERDLQKAKKAKDFDFVNL